MEETFFHRGMAVLYTSFHQITSCVKRSWAYTKKEKPQSLEIKNCGFLVVSVKPPGLINPGRETLNQDIQFNEQDSGAYPGSRPFAQSSFVRSRVGAVRRTQTRYL